MPQWTKLTFFSKIKKKFMKHYNIHMIIHTCIPVHILSVGPGNKNIKNGHKTSSIKTNMYKIYKKINKSYTHLNAFI